MENARVLVLNADYRPLSYLPLSTISWQDCVKLIIFKNSKILESLPNIYIRSQKIRIPFPLVLLINNYIKTDYKVRLTKHNIFIRDFYSCAFCGEQFLFEKEKLLTIDHIIPKSKGGNSNWTNVITSCIHCNNKKGNKIKFPKTLPKKPTYNELVNKRKKLPVFIHHESWIKYIDWEEKNIILI